MITKYIAELLYERECVIVPEFGAFISKEASAMVDYVNHRLTPPSKEVVFNSQLVTDDGVLVDYLSVRMNVAREKASKMIRDFAMKSLAVLESDESLHLDGIGTLTRINSRDFSLKLDEGLNFLGDAYGLNEFTVQPIYRRETYQHIAEQIATQQKAKSTRMTVHEEEQESKPHHVNRHNYKWFRAAAYSMLIAFVLVLLGWGADKSGSNLVSWNPFFYSSPNEFIAKYLNNSIESCEFANVATLPALEVTVPIVENEIQLKQIDYEELKPVDVNLYYIIGASLTNEADAQRCAKKFQKQGFEGAVALPKNEKGNVRVAYELVRGRAAALQRLEIIKKDYNEAAWMLRKR